MRHDAGALVALAHGRRAPRARGRLDSGGDDRPRAAPWQGAIGLRTRGAGQYGEPLAELNPDEQPAGGNDRWRRSKGKTLFITGASRGIGLAIALRAARDGANIAIAAKTAEPHPKLEGTIYTAAKEIEAAGGKALPLVCDIRFEEQVQAAVEQDGRRRSAASTSASTTPAPSR